MSKFRYGHGRGKDWHEAAQSCLAQLGKGGTLGFLYATDLLSERLEEILTLFRRGTGVEHWVGTVGMGVCATGQEYLDECAIVAMTGEFEPASFRIFSDVTDQDSLEALNLECGGGPATFAMVHANPNHAEIPALIAGLAEKVESGFLTGGLTSSRQRNLQIADDVSEGIISGVAFADTVTVATRLTQGCTPIGPKHMITAAQRNVLLTLDGRPALEVLKEDIGEERAESLNRIGGSVFVGLPIPGSDTGDYLVRHLVGLDPANQLVAIGEMVQPGGSVMFCARNRATAREDMSRMLESIRAGLYAEPRGGVYYSCLGRGAELFGADSQELKMIRESLGDVPLVGFFCSGEISHNRLYGYTGVLTLFV
jgi:small ligand-binding sensory domain FIST